ncbi:MAG TPA: branched-chain amino acid ABC transporter permease, partial [Desulfobacterales bacterium]|nr:branched-chain amino acid ABC transporter permease [Desulfobacterales bacterium]
METGHRRKERLDRGVKVRTEGLYALMSWRELGYLTMPRLVLIIGMLILPLVMPSMYWQRVISIVCIYALLSLSFDFLA